MERFSNGHQIDTKPLVLNRPESRSPEMTLRMLRRRGRRCELAESPLRLGASRRAPSRIDCLARRRVHMPGDGCVLREEGSRLKVPWPVQYLAWGSPPGPTV